MLGAHDEDAHRDAAHQPAVCARVRASQYVRLCVSLSRWLAPWVYVYVCGPLSLSPCVWASQSVYVCEPRPSLALSPARCLTQPATQPAAAQEPTAASALPELRVRERAWARTLTAGRGRRRPEERLSSPSSRRCRKYDSFCFFEEQPKTGDLLGSATEAWNAAGSLAWQARVPRTRLARASALARVRGPGAWSTCACSCARSRRVSYVYPRGEACVWPRSRCRWRRMRRFVDQRVCMCRHLYAHVHASMHACLQLCVLY